MLKGLISIREMYLNIFKAHSYFLLNNSVKMFAIMCIDFKKKSIVLRFIFRNNLKKKTLVHPSSLIEMQLFSWFSSILKSSKSAAAGG